MIQRYIYETLHPEIYHGYGKKPPFFEGWYFKMISADESSRYAVIPGIFTAKDRSVNHAFVQVLDGMTGTATYHEYPLEAFRADEEIFDVWVGNNHFRSDGLSLHIDDDSLKLHGELHFGKGEPWPVNVLSPGVMGWYAWMPIMECYHGILSFDHSVDGAFEVNGKQVDFSGGRGYIEKDWGQAFPAGYVWQQSNHFSEPGISLSASIAIVPSIGRTFRGFTVGLLYNGHLYRFATYTGAVTDKLAITDDHVVWHLRDKHHRLEMISERQSGGLLHAPIRTEMHKRVDETLQANVQVKFTRVDGSVIFEDTGRNAGLEVYGDLDSLLNMR